MAKCRFCDNYTGELVKYGIRHHAHHRCYLDNDKRLEDLHDWQIVLFPYLLLKSRGLLEITHAAQARIDAKKDGSMTQQIDEAEIAELVSQAINGTLAESSKEELGWGAIGLDIGEIEITLKGGRMFRLVVEEIES